MLETCIVVTGPMKAGKSQAAVNQYDRWQREGLRVAAFLPAIAAARDGAFIRSRAGGKVPARLFTYPLEILQAVQAEALEAVIIGEVQFVSADADPDLGAAVQELKRRGVRLFLEGLARDFLDRPFPSMQQVLPHATEVRVLDAVCDVCRRSPARYTQRLIDGKPAPPDQPAISVEGQNRREVYEVRCRLCFVDVLPRPWAASSQVQSDRFRLVRRA